MNNTPITIETTIDAPASEVWNFWTMPAHIMNWNFATPEWHCPSSDNDLREGGSFRYTMAARDGSMSFDFEGAYNKVIPHHEINYSLADGRQVTVNFQQQDAQTRIVQSFEPDETHPREMQQAGWQAILDNFKSYVSTQAG